MLKRNLKREVKKMKYIIPKNSHYSLHIPRIYSGDKTDFFLLVKFTDSCRYKSKDPKNQKDVNKLFGVSFGYHKHDSIRIGWNYNPETDKIDIYRYEYNKGKRTIELIDSFNIDEEYGIILFLTDDGYIISTSGNITKEYKFEYPVARIGYYLYPYFGGDEKTQHMIIINLKILR